MKVVLILCRIWQMEAAFRHLPSVDKLLSHERVRELEREYPHELLVSLIRKVLEHERMSISSGKPGSKYDSIVKAVLSEVKALEKPSLSPVINASGVILHTNLGRAPLSHEAIAAMESVSRGYCNLEINMESGTRGSRNVHVESLLCQLTGAEAALVVNNNAAAVLLGLITLARRKEVVVSRGQAVEIGGGFRIPDVMRQSGAKLIEVGTTNCTYARDFEEAINPPKTVALMRIHSSNFKLVGFTNEVTMEELAAIGERHDIPVFDDLGSGCFLDTTAFGLAAEPMVQQSVSLGAGLVFFSGDKLVGGPQAGIIVGRRQYVDKLRKHPLARAVRIDKIRLAGLAATLLHYLKGQATARIPIWRMISAPLEEIDRRANLWAQAAGSMARVISGETMIGGGSLPGGTMPTKLVAIGSGDKESLKLARKISRELREQSLPVIGRISDDILLLDPRSVLPEEDKAVCKALQSLSINF